ncbi:nucleoside hydrolase [Subtercola boreus]|uniref:Nucleoside hydrolase n=1 Tax=Subtercola boreus TaxID=120213 RepID=A0A3E0VNF1_9MICO|nr:nucleoside hydrolase [Subtercola boreus]RFA10417.1 nucleoside hydrolase [Subtercola boreus]TQL56061.1 purine nucleosidase [Subtercola boreus]
MRPTIVITDPGQEQAAALMVILASPEEFEVLAIVGSAGNTTLDRTVRNILQVVELTGRTGIHVHRGCPRPLVRELVTAAHVHGETGMDGYPLHEPRLEPSDEPGVQAIIRHLRAAEPHSVTVMQLSSMTTLAVALVEAPDIAASIREIVMMAGAYFEVGNITPTAEFNIYVDPHAADIVLRSGVPIVMLPLDVTHQLHNTRERLDRFSALGNQCGRVVDALLTFSETFDLAKYGTDGAPLHGPVVPLYCLHPELFGGRQINARVEISSELTMGMLAADWWQITDLPRNIFYARTVDAPAFYTALLALIARLP